MRDSGGGYPMHAGRAQVGDAAVCIRDNGDRKYTVGYELETPREYSLLIHRCAEGV